MGTGGGAEDGGEQRPRCCQVVGMLSPGLGKHRPEQQRSGHHRNRRKHARHRQRPVKSAANNGAFDGSSGITSSVAKTINADSTPLHHTGLGYAVASSVNLSSVDSTSVNPTDVVVKYTLIGDANLDGVVNALDFNALATNFGSSNDWSHGDYTYDGTVDVNDFVELAKNFNAPLPAPPASPALGITRA